MLSSSCPSCGSPITFAHGASLTTVCASCSSTVVRDGLDLKSYGQIARIQRDLSPLQIGATGRAEAGAFRVVGALRKGREGVRWNEWFLVFDNGQTGWLGEGNGLYQLFVGAPLAERIDLPSYGALHVGKRFEFGGNRWEVSELAEAVVLAAEGELPMALSPQTRFAYADLRRLGGSGVGTLDYTGTDSGGSPDVWLGRAVALTALNLEGLRAFAGWSDPALVHFAGPEVPVGRALQCAGCGAAIKLCAPGSTQRLVCPFCGASNDLDDDGHPSLAANLQEASKKAWSPSIPLGTKGTLKGLPWQVIGAQERYVEEEGVRYHWTEYLLFNPYRGFQWLVQDGQNQWSIVEVLAEAIDPKRMPWRFRGEDFTPFQSGEAVVSRVLGEFTWEIRRGDRALTWDAIAPPKMLSMEKSGDEVSWSLGEWAPTHVISEAFRVSLPASRGVAPHQPNTINRLWPMVAGMTGLLGAAWVFNVALLRRFGGGGVLKEVRGWQATPEVGWQSVESVTLSAAGVYEFEVLAPSGYGVVSMIGKNTGQVVDLQVDNLSAATVVSLQPDTFLFHAEAAPGLGGLRGTARVSGAPRYIFPHFLSALYLLIGPVMFFWLRSSVEKKRWETSSFLV